LWPVLAIAAIAFGPRENGHRPSIDVCFDPRPPVTPPVAVLLTGYLHDGVAGLSAVKRCGGVTMVQNPEAEAPDLPSSAIQNSDVDHVLSLNQIAAKIVELTRQPASRVTPSWDDFIPVW